MRILLAATLIFLSSAGLSFAEGPFGVTFGSNIEEYKGCTRLEKEPGYRYICNSVPRPHPDFSAYMLETLSGVGICRVFAISKTIQVNSYGIELKTLIDDIKNQLESKYGQPSKKKDEAFGMFKDAQYWMMALRANERDYNYLWENTLPDGISSIFLSAGAIDSTHGNALLMFSSPNAAACDAAIQKSKAGAF